MEVPIHNVEGQIAGKIELDPEVFGVPLNWAVVHQALVRQRANARAGTASTKTRGEVAGSTRKLYRQKHTGWARAGGLRSPVRRHGGVTFGPKPRSYRQRMPKKMRRLAIRCLLSAKLADGELRVIDKLELEEPRTKNMPRLLEALKLDSSTLIATSSPNANVILSVRNLEGLKAIPASLLNAVDLCSHRFLLLTVDAVHQIEKLWGRK